LSKHWKKTVKRQNQEAGEKKGRENRTNLQKKEEKQQNNAVKAINKLKQ
jgi:hypothetical protein